MLSNKRPGLPDQVRNMPPEKPRRTLLAVLLVAALGLFASTPSSADEPALPQFDPDSVVELENGLNWIDLNGDGVEDPVVMSRSHRRATFMHFDFYLRDLDPVDGNEWSYIDDGSFHAEEEYGCQEYALRVARRLDRPSGPLTVVIAWRLYDDSTLGSCDPRSVEFEFYELVLLVNGGAKLVHPGGAKLVHLTLCGTRCWGVAPVVHRRDPRCFV